MSANPHSVSDEGASPADASALLPEHLLVTRHRIATDRARRLRSLSRSGVRRRTLPIVVVASVSIVGAGLADRFVRSTVTPVASPVASVASAAPPASAAQSAGGASDAALRAVARSLAADHAVLRSLAASVAHLGATPPGAAATAAGASPASATLPTLPPMPALAAIPVASAPVAAAPAPAVHATTGASKVVP